MNESISIAGVKLTHPERIMYPELGISKGELASYYLKAADKMLPHITNRPLSLVRCPRGEGQQCFYQRNYTVSLPDEVDAVQVEEKSGERAVYIQIRDLAGLIALVQVGVLEIHPWGSRSDRLDRPDQIIFDLDPNPDVPWGQVVMAARRVRERLDYLGLESFVKTSGGKGLHVAVPLVRRTDWDTVSQFTEAVAKGIAREFSDDVVAEGSKEKRTGKVFIDYLRNYRGASNVAPYSTRARGRAPVSTPVGWVELDRLAHASAFNISNLPQRLSRNETDPWAGYFDVHQSITKKMEQALGLG